MAHEVETMAFANAVPWHGLGVNVSDKLTPKAMAHAAGIDWTVSLRPLMTTPRYEDGEDWDGETVFDVPTHRALVRDTDNKVLTVVGDSWRPLQNLDAMRFFTEFTAAGGAKMETAGSLRGGTVIWGLADLGDKFTVAGKTDQVRGYLLLMSPHILGRSIIARVTGVRVVCANTMAMALSGSSAIERRWNHTTEFNPTVAAEAMGVVREDFVKFGKVANQLAKLKLSREEVLAILAPVYDPANADGEAVQVGAGAVAGLKEWAAEYTPSRTVAKLLESYDSAPGAQPGTGWGVLNAVTHFTDHVAGRNADQRLTSSWMGGAANRRQRVLDTLTALAG